MEVDEALGKLGTIGRWQVVYYTMISTACMVTTCFHMLAIIYIGIRYEHPLAYFELKRTFTAVLSVSLLV